MKKYGSAGQVTDDNIIRRMRFACWVTKDTAIHSEYVIFIAFTRQKLLRERARMLSLYVRCLSCLIYAHSLNTLGLKIWAILQPDNTGEL
jgi:hypothetical protein